MFKHMDANGDGKVSADELDKMRGMHLQACDKDKNGDISQDEMANCHTMMNHENMEKHMGMINRQACRHEQDDAGHVQTDAGRQTCLDAASKTVRQRFKAILVVQSRFLANAYGRLRVLLEPPITCEGLPRDALCTTPDSQTVTDGTFLGGTQKSLPGGR